MSTSGEPTLEAKMEALSRRLSAKTGLSNEIERTLRGLILAGELRPGDRIVESRIARQLGVGQPTVREALIALEHNGLVYRKANYGCVVTTFTRNEIAEILTIRSHLETLAVDLATENGSDAAIQKVWRIAQQMVQSASAGDANSFHEQDQTFHEALWECTGNAFLQKILSQIMLPLLAFLFIRTSNHTGHINLVRSAEVHVDIANAVLSRDKAAARRVAAEAFYMFAEQHLNAIDSQPSPFNQKAH